MIQRYFFCFNDSLPLASRLLTHTVADVSDLGLVLLTRFLNSICSSTVLSVPRFEHCNSAK